MEEPGRFRSADEKERNGNETILELFFDGVKEPDAVQGILCAHNGGTVCDGVHHVLWNTVYI